MDIIELPQQPQVSAPTPQPQLPKQKRGRRPRSGDSSGGFRRVRISPSIGPAVVHLKNELRLRSECDAIHWLLHQVRPELVPSLPDIVSRTHRDRNSVNDDSAPPKPLCMVYLDNGKPGLRDLVASGGGSPVKATVVQASTVFFNTPATLEKAERLISRAAAYGSQLVVFPEAFVGGYPRCMAFDGTTSSHSAAAETNGDDDDLHKYFASAIDVPGPEVDKLAKMAGKYRVHLVIGVVERTEFSLFSTVLFFDTLGRHLGQFRKLVLMGSESAVWHSGEKSPLSIYETSIGKIGGLVCWDNKYPLLRTELYDKGVEIYCAPTADARDVWKASMMHIAMEGSCFVLSANQFCRRRDYPLRPGNSDGEMQPDAITCAGGSVIVSPLGSILAGPNYYGECLVSADLDLGEIIRAKTEFGCGESILGANHISFTANGPNPVLVPTDKKPEEHSELSW